MNEKISSYKNQMQQYWQERTKKQKTLILGSFIGLLTFIIILTIIVSHKNYVPLYSGLSPEETGQIKGSLDTKGITYEIANNGTVINVPEDRVDTLKVELATEGIPESGAIDYKFFGENNGFGMTDKEFGVLERAAMQTELQNLIGSIEGVKNSKVMINLPKENVWVTDAEETASASIVLDLKPGYTLKQKQVNSLYHLVSKSVPSLPIDNIVIMDQYFNYFDISTEQESTTLSAYEQQKSIKDDIEKDLQRNLQRMLGTMMGPEKVVVSVTTDIDFTKEKRQEELVEPVDQDKMEGIQMSVERIRETYTGYGTPPGGVTGTGETDIPTYQGEDGQTGDYQRVEERINNEVNRIHKEVEEAPFTIRDIGIQVMVEPPDPENVNSLPAERLNDIEQVLSSVVRTTISKDQMNEITDEEIGRKIFVSAQPLNGKVEMPVQETTFPIWIYIVGGILLILIIILLVLLLRNRKAQTEDDDSTEVDYHIEDVPELKPQQTEETTRKQQLERLAKDKPDEFAKLLRSWLSDD
ncbi:flagellar basal-body MS-ring/collar protein FliF [Pseudalkalibacillus salsuginis]|uniref:flagellar basal-body MS-ring/collar protein FliF n=1 Tax=Pseudalkalibacillus salsuginis TaxID=2910972 RepID=UPI001F1CD535|nr:flagellar basal-body MS-ring/collar protein FliF [Pseudalkalibacillus salsuginis]MCF6410564.1 flagellar M-ring protein FliF [Pseudalkalibacillus salsuginis]